MCDKEMPFTILRLVTLDNTERSTCLMLVRLLYIRERARSKIECVNTECELTLTNIRIHRETMIPICLSCSNSHHTFCRVFRQ